jgi:hypothetical protein
MKVEIHCHTNIHSACSTIPPHELVNMAEASGYDALFITDHRKVWSKRALAELREYSSSVRIFGGIEVTFDSGIDVLVLGPEDEKYESLDTPDQLFAQACADGFATVVAHPFRWVDQLPEFCRLADGIEIRTCNHPEDDQAAIAVEYAKKHRLAELYASDAHGLNFMNRYWIETEDAFEDPLAFRRQLLSRRYRNQMREEALTRPPLYKASTMEELSEEDRHHLQVQPA